MQGRREMLRTSQSLRSISTASMRPKRGASATVWLPLPQ